MILDSFTAQFSPDILQMVGFPPNDGELISALKQMASSKSLSLDWILTNFYKQFWRLLDVEFTQMIHHAVVEETLP